MQAYSDPKRAEDKYALPDISVFFIGANDDDWRDDDGECLPEGWYYWYCFPGCMPEEDYPHGPFMTADSAIAYAQKEAQDA